MTASLPRSAPLRPASGEAVVRLCYPSHWHTPLAPHAAQMEREARRWLTEQGVLTSRRDHQRFEALAVGPYANWPFPRAPAPVASAITRFLALWIFYDDCLEEHGEGALQAVCEAIAGRLDPAEAPTPHLRAWAALGRIFARWTPPSWRQRHADHFTDWVASVHEESVAARALRAGQGLPSAAAHLERRRKNIGMIPNINFLEVQLGWTLPEAALAEPSLVRARDAAAEAVAIINDLFGVSKDHQNQWVNLVSSLAAERRQGWADAFAHAATLHQQRCEAMDAALTALCERSADPRLDDWATGLRHIVYGFARWHALAPRYRARHTLDDEIIRIEVAAPR